MLTESVQLPVASRQPCI